jgi:hypothetical protein
MDISGRFFYSVLNPLFQEVVMIGYDLLPSGDCIEQTRCLLNLRNFMYVIGEALLTVGMILVYMLTNKAHKPIRRKRDHIDRYSWDRG